MVGAAQACGEVRERRLPNSQAAARPKIPPTAAAKPPHQYEACFTAIHITGLSNMLAEMWQLASSHRPSFLTTVAVQRERTSKSRPSVRRKWSLDLPKATPTSP